MEKYNLLTVISFENPHITKGGSKLKKVKCKCECGNEISVLYQNVKNGNSKSCGCLNIQKRQKHNLRSHPLYKTYYNILQRCNNPNKKGYENYGGRGIKCLFKDVEHFYNTMINTWQNGLSIERIDVNGNYEPNNCKWIPMQEQHKNKRKTTSAPILAMQC